MQRSARQFLLSRALRCFLSLCACVCVTSRHLYIKSSRDFCCCRWIVLGRHNTIRYELPLFITKCHGWGLLFTPRCCILWQVTAEGSCLRQVAAFSDMYYCLTLVPGNIADRTFTLSNTCWSQVEEVKKPQTGGSRKNFWLPFLLCGAPALTALWMRWEYNGHEKHRYGPSLYSLLSLESICPTALLLLKSWSEPAEFSGLCSSPGAELFCRKRERREGGEASEPERRGKKNVYVGDPADSSAILGSSSDALGGDGRSRKNLSSWVINESTVEGYTEKYTDIETGWFRRAYSGSIMALLRLWRLYESSIKARLRLD